MLGSQAGSGQQVGERAIAERAPGLDAGLGIVAVAEQDARPVGATHGQAGEPPAAGEANGDPGLIRHADNDVVTRQVPAGQGGAALDDAGRARCAGLP